ncbi:MAG: Uncharacterized protein G01um101431_124 [Parcubacteria group bacterium Gr01-1014_31]|nr:MAG: Uncharacterized protein G01um101431_124 [Parcubacteria group bacterium Gr01-1014_31]
MRIPLPTDHPLNLRDFLMRCGYSSHFNPLSNRLSFMRRFSGGLYPRFHLYIEKDVDGKTYFNLHLDQKQPSYPNAHAHNAEYDGALVVREGERLYQQLQTASLPQPAPVSPKRSWWPWGRSAE